VKMDTAADNRLRDSITRITQEVDSLYRSIDKLESINLRLNLKVKDINNKYDSIKNYIGDVDDVTLDSIILSGFVHQGAEGIHSR